MIRIWPLALGVTTIERPVDPITYNINRLQIVEWKANHSVSLSRGNNIICLIIFLQSFSNNSFMSGGETTDTLLGRFSGETEMALLGASVISCDSGCRMEVEKACGVSPRSRGCVIYDREPAKEVLDAIKAPVHTRRRCSDLQRLDGRNDMTSSVGSFARDLHDTRNQALILY